MRYLPVRIQSQDPHLLFTTLLHGYHVTHLIEFVFIDSFISRRAEANKPTLLLLQIEHNGNLIGLYSEDGGGGERAGRPPAAGCKAGCVD